MEQFTEMLHAAEAGDPDAADRLLPLVYAELRKLAAYHLTHEQPGQTLQPTALVHEAYLRLVGNRDDVEWNGRKHFFGAAAIAIRRILIENGRRKQTLKRGCGQQPIPLEGDVPLPLPEPREDLLALDEALRKLAGIHRQAAELVELLYFGGLTQPQAAEALGVSPRTAGRLWSYARAWLRREMEGMEDRAANL